MRGCAKEEEVKTEFCKFFKMKIFALRGIDHYTDVEYFKSFKRTISVNIKRTGVQNEETSCS